MLLDLLPNREALEAPHGLRFPKVFPSAAAIIRAIRSRATSARPRSCCTRYIRSPKKICRESLRKLVDAELIYVHGIPPEAKYIFKHALIRDAAYEALLRSRRKDLHRLVARTIGEKFIALKDAQPEVLARHWTEAGEINPAIAEWCRAGKAAEARNAFGEALAS